MSEMSKHDPDRCACRWGEQPCRWCWPDAGPQDAAQAPQDGANGGDVGSGRGEGVLYLSRGMTEGRCLTCPGGHGAHYVGGKFPELPHEVVVETRSAPEHEWHRPDDLCAESPCPLYGQPKGDGA